MMLRVAWRSVVTRPVRVAVLAAGFGFGIAVMVVLLGVGQVILEQSHAPALAGGGDLVVSGPFGAVTSARYVVSSLRRAPEIADRVAAISVSRRARLFLITPGKAIPVAATGGVPSLEKALGDPEVSNAPAWSDRPGDGQWSDPQPGDVLRALDRFHPIPPAGVSPSSWAEWLYFNARTADGRLRVYVTFLVGPPASRAGARQAGVRLQLERDGRASTYSAGGEIDEAAVLKGAPDLEIAGNRVRLDGTTYRITLALAENTPKGDPPRRLTGELLLAAAPQSLPPAAIHGAKGWVSGYVVPVLSGRLSGMLNVQGQAIEIADAAGYHDHNWGFWEGVTWQWGQVAHGDVSIVYGRVFPPADVADASRIPGFLAVLGPTGPLGFSAAVTIDDTNAGTVDIRASRGGRIRAENAIDLHLVFSAAETVRTAMTMTNLPGRQPMHFLQMGGTYQVSGEVGGRTLDFTARGSAETFKPR